MTGFGRYPLCMARVALQSNTQLRGDEIVNVATVPQRSPFRYPGGKTWLIPLARQWLGSLSQKPACLVEAFAGGASVGLCAGVEGFVGRVSLVELDPAVAIVWKVVFGEDGAELIDRIRTFQLTAASVRSVLESRPRGSVERAFATLLRNRVQHGGILAPGASLMKEGENGKGLASRWYAETLARRIAHLWEHRGRFTVLEGDGLRAISASKDDPGVCYFIDPPYTIAGRRLYTFSQLDHGELFRRAAEVAGPVLLTYDDTEEVRGLAEGSGLQWARVPMKSRQHVIKNELLISRDLSWFG